MPEGKSLRGTVGVGQTEKRQKKQETENTPLQVQSKTLAIALLKLYIRVIRYELDLDSI